MVKFNWNDYEFKVIQYGRGVYKENMSGHSHAANSYELHYILGGKGTLVTDTNSFEVKKGDLFVTGPFAYHQQNTDKSDPLEEVHVYLQTSGEKTNNALASAFLNSSFFFSHQQSFAPLFENILFEKSKKQIGYESVVAADLQIILTKISRLYLPETLNVPLDSDNLNDKRFLIIENAFMSHPQELTIAKLSDMIGLCERQTQRLLKKYYGKTFSEKQKEAISFQK